MILGIGIDLIEKKRLQQALAKERFSLKYYTSRERELGRWQKLANNFAVKEAVVKALGTGFSKISLREIEVLRNERGKPYVVLYGVAKKLSLEKGIKRIHVSISDTNDFITAMAIMER